MTGEATFTRTLLDHARHEGRETHARVLALVADLTDDQLRWRPAAHAPSIGFHLWHLARWADYDAHQVEGSPQVWHARALAAAWGFPEALGEADSGTEMGDDASERLVLPGKAPLIDYARAAFTSIDDSLDRLAHDALLQSPRVRDLGEARAVDFLHTYLTHDNRHLGMIEALRGLLGLQGTATN